MGLAWKSRPRPYTVPSDCVGLFLGPQIPDKVHKAQHTSESEDEHNWAVKILGPDDPDPGEDWG